VWLRCPIEPSSCRLSDDKDVRLDNEEEHSRIFQVCLELFRLIYQQKISWNTKASETNASYAKHHITQSETRT